MLRHRSGNAQEVYYVSTHGSSYDDEYDAERSYTSSPRSHHSYSSYNSNEYCNSPRSTIRRQVRQVSPDPYTSNSNSKPYYERKDSNKYMKYRPVQHMPMDIDCKKSSFCMFTFLIGVVIVTSASFFVKTTMMQQSINNVLHNSGSKVDMLHRSIADMEDDLIIHRNRLQELQDINDDLVKSTDSLSSKTRHLSSELTRRNKEFIQHENHDIHTKLPQMRKKDMILSKKINMLVDKIQRDSYRDAYERFGPGPHQVEFIIELPDASSFQKFVIELAPLEKMPHSVHLFLDQVYHELWNDCSFVFNAPHVIQAGAFPVSNSGKSFEDKMEEFEEVGLESVHFQEYNSEFPHEEWTVGFADTGPDFYINIQDNTEKHGPRSSGGELFDESVDPCFGKVVSGHETIKRIHELPVDSDYVLESLVRIVKARIVGVEHDHHGAQYAPHDMKDKHFTE